MNVSLTPQLEAMVHEKVASGLYTSASEVIREALRLLDEYDRLRTLRLVELRREIAAGIADVESGTYREHGPDDLKDLGRRIKASGRQRREEAGGE